MRVLLAPERFTGALTAAQAARAYADGWAAGAPHDEVVPFPMSDGSDGFVDAMAAHLEAETLATTVSSPDGTPVPAQILLHRGRDKTTAYIEAAQAAGAHLGSHADSGSSRGVGELLLQAKDAGAERIVVGTGGVGTLDAGLGLLTALGVPAPSICEVESGMSAPSLPGLREMAASGDWASVVLATDRSLALLGFHGACATDGGPLGLSPEATQRRESAFGHVVDAVARAIPPRRDLVTGAAHRWDRMPGAGTGGGFAHVLLALGASAMPGAQLVAHEAGLDAALDGVGLVVTGEAVTGAESTMDSVTLAVSEAAARRAVPVILVSGEVDIGRRELMSMGISGAYPVVERLGQRPPGPGEYAPTLAQRVTRVARTWSPPVRPPG